MSIPNFGIRFNFRIQILDLGYVLGYARLPKTSLGYVLGYEAILGYDLLFWDTISNFGIRFGIRQANTAHAVEALDFRALVKQIHSKPEAAAPRRDIAGPVQ